MTTNVEGNIVDLGTLDALGGAAANFNRFGVNLRALKNSRFVNNVIHGGVDNPTGTGNVNVALTLEARTNPPAPAEIGDTMLVAHNTLFPGGPRSGSAGAMVLSGIKNISVVDNLALIPQMAGSTVRGLVISCKETANAPIIASMRNNALVGDSALAQLDSCPSSTIFAADPFNAEPSFADKGGNVTVFSNCNGDATTCFQSASCGANCPGLVIPGWSPTTYGADLLFGAGLKLGASTTCLVTAGGASLDPATDLAGVARTTKASIGAYELDGVCP
jgi:hypothetical protein